MAQAPGLRRFHEKLVWCILLVDREIETEIPAEGNTVQLGKTGTDTNFLLLEIGVCPSVLPP